MVVSPQGLLRDGGQEFSDTARSALPSVGEPSWFAPPVDVRGDGESVTILFHVPESVTELRAEVCESSLIVRARLPAKGGGWRPRRATRVFALPFEASRRSLTTSRRGEIFHVRVRRSNPNARDLAPKPEPLERLL